MRNSFVITSDVKPRKKRMKPACFLWIMGLMVSVMAQAESVGVRDLFTKKFDGIGNCFDSIADGKQEYGPTACDLTINYFYHGKDNIFDIMIESFMGIRPRAWQLINDELFDLYRAEKVGMVIGNRIEIGRIGSKNSDWILIEAKDDNTLFMQEFTVTSARSYSRSEIKLFPAGRTLSNHKEWSPSIGDQATFTVNSGKRERVRKIVEKKQDSFLILEKPGWVDHDITWWATTDDLKSEIIINVDTFCSQRSGLIEEVAVPAGTFRSCRVRDDRTGVVTWYVANLPFVTFVKQIDAIFEYKLKTHFYLR